VLDDLYGQIIEMPFPELPNLNREQRVRHIVMYLFRFVVENRDVVRVLLRHVMQNGRLPETVLRKWMGPTIQKITELEAALQIGPLQEKRLALLSLNHLLARYAVTDPVDWATVVGEGNATLAVEHHLGDVAVKLLL
jgi:hypothetical protein